MSTLYVAPISTGTGDGTSIQNAASLNNLNTLITKAGPGGTIDLIADQGAYNLTNGLTITAGGSAGAAVTIQGVNSQGQAMNAVIDGTRDPNWVAGEAAGPEVMRLMNGASNLNFSDLTIENASNAFRIGADINNITISGVTAQNVSSLVMDMASGGNATASVNGLTVQNSQVTGYSYAGILLDYNSQNVTINNVAGDVHGETGAAMLFGVHLQGTVHDVLIENSSMKGNVWSGASYWNGDGYATEAGVSNVTFLNDQSSGNADAGFDIKSASTTLTGVDSFDNNRNFRLWNTDTVLDDVTGSSPHHLGGTGSMAQVWLGAGAHATITDSTFTDSDANTAVYNLDEAGATLSLSGDSVTNAQNTAPVLGHGSSITQVTETSTSTAEPPPPPTDTQSSGSGSSTSDGSSSTSQSSGSSTDDSSGSGSQSAGSGSSTSSGSDTAVQTASAGTATTADPQNIDGDTGNNTIHGGDGSDFIRGLDGNDSISGGAGDDLINGNKGSDTIIGGSGSDTLFGGQGNDSVFGSAAGNDSINGNMDNDTIHAGSGASTIYGGQGGDSLVGGAGNDVLSGDLGNDTMTGGAGADHFMFRHGSGQDWITDFNSAAGDRVVLPTGTTYTLTTYDNQVVVDLGHGDTLGLAGVAPNQLGDWLVYG